jgi:hypothetical protein
VQRQHQDEVRYLAQFPATLPVSKLVPESSPIGPTSRHGKFSVVSREVRLSIVSRSRKVVNTCSEITNIVMPKTPAS